MSIRTIIEINHDYLHELSSDPEHWIDLLRAMRSSDLTGALNAANGKPVFRPPGIRILAQRHHSEMLKLEVK